MRLCFPLKPQIGGGVYSFARNFRNYLDSVEYPWTNDLADEYDTLLI